MSNWSFSSIWNESLIEQDRREFVPRDYMWASELGGAPINIYYAMKGVAPSNPPNARSLRKFQAGHIWEWIVRLVLQRAGIIIAQQERIRVELPGMLMVSGKQDFTAGGKLDYDKAYYEIKQLDLPEMMANASFAIVEQLKKIHGDKPLTEIIMEIKSCSDVMFDRYAAIGANPHHILQCTHYLLGKNMNEGKIVYINKDNCMLLEHPVYNPSKSVEDYKRFVSMMTDIIKSGKAPDKMPEIKFDTLELKFSKEFTVEYSNYLTMIYGYKTPEEYRERWDKLLKSFNRVYKRCVTGSKMTQANLDVIEEAKRYFPMWDDLVDIGKSRKDELVEEEVE